MPDGTIKPETAACPCCGTIITPARAAIGAHPSTEEAAEVETAPTLYDRIHAAREDLFGVGAVIDVAQCAADPDNDHCADAYSVWRAIGDAVKRLYAIADALEMIADSRKLEREVSHG